jgi:GTP-binding protein
MRISCKTGKNIGKLLAIVKNVADRYSSRFPNDELTFLFKEALRNRQLFHQGRPLIVCNAKQIKTAPITIVLYVNEPKWFGRSQLGYFDNVLRKTYALEGVPVKLIVRKAS